MAVRNGLPYLGEAVDSILRQTYADFEFVIVDDASTDGSVDTIAAVRDPRIRFLRNLRWQGVGQCVAEAYASSTGEFIARMDADDVSYPHRFARSIELLESHPEVAMVAGSADRLYVEESRLEANYYAQTFGYQDLALPAENAAHLKRLLSTDNVICQPTVMIRRRALEVVGFYRLPFVEDYDLWLRITERFQALAAPEPWLLHRVHSHATSDRRWFQMRRHEWIVRNAAARRLAGREEHLLLLRLASAPATPIGWWIWMTSLGKALRMRGSILRRGRRPLAGTFWAVLGGGVQIVTHPISSVRGAARRLRRTS
jgi:glycosyltransferase involved in cell wall biosynthesis